MDSKAEWRDQRKESVNPKKEQQKMSILTTESKQTKVKIIRDSGTCMTIQNTRLLEGEEKDLETEKCLKKQWLPKFGKRHLNIQIQEAE